MILEYFAQWAIMMPIRGYSPDFPYQLSNTFSPISLLGEIGTKIVVVLSGLSPDFARLVLRHEGK